MLSKDSRLDTDLSQKLTPLPYSFAREHGVCLDQNSLYFKEEISIKVLSEIQRVLDFEPVIKVIVKDEFDQLLQKISEDSVSDTMQNIGGMNEVLDLNSIANELNEPEDILEHNNDAPIIKLLNALMTEAVRQQASDIHIEQYEGRLRIRFRVDGTLQEVLEPDLKIAPMIVSRIKVMAKLDIAEKRLPQDGRVSVKVGGRPVDWRIATIPTGEGFEKVVMRLLNKETGRLDLDYLGMPAEIKDKVNQIIKKPHGILLVTGPTGSGKTTSLYAMLSELNSKECNIMTIEDPVEYYLDGINQSQVNSKIEMTFVNALRSILRQDPDIIMIGEIRDAETAKIAIQASTTGHVVFSTLHANTAAGTITRLRDLEIEPFLLSSSLNGVLAQRLVRILCDCKTEHIADEAESKLLRIKKSTKIYRATGCDKCNYLGYKGRKGVFDLLVVDDTIKTMIHNNDSEQNIKNHVRKSSKGLLQMGIDLVLSGETSIDEIVRIMGSLKEN